MDLDITLDRKGKVTYRLENRESSEMSKSSGCTNQYLNSIPSNVNPTMLNLWGLKASSFQNKTHMPNRDASHPSKTKTTFAEKSPKAAGEKTNHKSKLAQTVVKEARDTGTQYDQVNEEKFNHGKLEAETSKDNSKKSEIHKNSDRKQVSSPKNLISFASSGRLSKESTPRSDKSRNMQSWASKRVNSPVTYKNPAENDWVVRTSVISNGRNVHRVTTDHSPVVMKREHFSDKTLEMCKSDPYLASLLFSKQQTSEKSLNGNSNAPFEPKNLADFTKNTDPTDEMKPQISSACDNHREKKSESDQIRISERELKVDCLTEELTDSHQAHILVKSNKQLPDIATESLPTISDAVTKEGSTQIVITGERDLLLTSSNSGKLFHPIDLGYGDRRSFNSEMENFENCESRISPLTFRPIGQQIRSPIYNSCDENEEANEVENQMQTFRGSENMASSRKATVLLEDIEKPQSVPQVSALRSRTTQRRTGKTPRTPSTSRRVTFRDEKSSSDSNLSDSCYGIPKPMPVYLRKGSNLNQKVKNESEQKQSAKKCRSVNGEQSKRNHHGSTRKKAGKAESSDDEFERFWKVSMEEWKLLSPYQKYLKYKTMTQNKPAETTDKSKRSKFLDSDSDTFLEKENLSQLRKKNESKPSDTDNSDVKTTSKAKEVCDSETDFKFGGGGKMKYYAELNDLAEDFLFSKPVTTSLTHSLQNTGQLTDTVDTPVALNSTSASWDLKSFRGETSFRTESGGIVNNVTDDYLDDTKREFVSEENGKAMHESLLLETYRSKETERKLDHNDLHAEDDDDAESIVSVSTFMPETLRSISEAFSRIEGSTSKLSLNDTHDSIAEFLFTSRRELSRIDNDEKVKSDEKDPQMNEKSDCENIEVESGSADSLIDKLYDEPDRKISAVRPIGQKNQYIMKSSVDDFLTFKEFVNPYQDSVLSAAEEKRKAKGLPIGFEELDQIVADKFGGETVRDMCKDGSETSRGMVLESVNAEESCLNEAVQLASSIPTNFAKIRAYKHTRTSLKREEDKRNETTNTTNELKVGQNRNLQTNQPQLNPRGSRPGSKSPLAVQHRSGSPRSRPSYRRSRSPKQKVSRPNVSPRQGSNGNAADPQRSPRLQPPDFQGPGSDSEAIESRPRQTSAAAQLPGNSDGNKAPINQRTTSNSQANSQGQYVNPNPQSRIPAHSPLGVASAPRIVNVKEALQKGHHGPPKVPQKGTSQTRENKHIADNPNLLQSQNINLAGVAIKSRSNSPHLVRPSSGNRVRNAPTQTRNPSPVSAARVRHSQHSPSNLASPRQNAAQRQSRSPSPSNLNASPRHRNPKEERFSKYLTELHASLIQRSVLSTPSLSDAGVRQKCGSLLASPMNRNNAEPNMWLAIPPEMWLYIFSLLAPADRCTLGLACRSLYNLSCDFTLWGTIIVKGKTLNPHHLKSIQVREPKSLSLLQCDFKGVNDEHLRTFFREISDSLQELNIAGCTSKDCNANTILVHAGTRCSNLVSLDTSWSNLGPHTLVAFGEHVRQLESLSLNGCASITDDCVTQVLEKHGQTMKKLTVFGCYKLDRSLLKLPSLAPNMQVLHLGNIPYVTDDTLRQIAMALKDLREIDIRSSRNITDEAIYSLSFYCRRLTSLNMSNCTQLSDYSMANLGGYCMNLSNLEVDGCSRISDEGVQKLLIETRVIMRKLGLSATNVTSEACNVIRDHCPVLEELKLSSCQAKISIESLKALISKVKSLRSLDLYGFDKTRVSKNLVGVNKNLQIHV